MNSAWSASGASCLKPCDQRSIASRSCSLWVSSTVNSWLEYCPSHPSTGSPMFTMAIFSMLRPILRSSLTRSIVAV